MPSITNWVIGREPIRRVGDDALVPLRVPWYRSLPLSSLESLSLRVDGRDVPAEDLRVTVNGGHYSLEELAERSEEFWFVQDTAFVPLPATSLGAEAAVTASATFRIPYIFVGPDKPLRRVVSETVLLPVEKEESA